MRAILVSSLLATFAVTSAYGWEQTPTEAAQCRFNDGMRVVLIGGASSTFDLFVLEDENANRATITLLPGGGREIEANGGVATYAVLEKLFEDLHARLEPVP